MNKKTLLTIIIEAAIFIVILFGVGNFYSKKLNVVEHNLNSAKSKIEQVELKNGELLSIKESYVLKMNELEDELGISKNEIKELRKALDGRVAYIAELESHVRIDTVILIRDSIVYKDNDKYTAFFDYNDKWLTLSGNHSFSNGKVTTSFNKIDIYTPLQFGISDDYKIWVKSENPYVQFDNINGAVIDGSALKPKKKMFNWGLQFGFGLMYDIIDKNMTIGPYGGLGVEYNF